MAALAGKCQEVFVIAVRAFDPGKAVMQIAAVKIAINHFFDIGPPKTVLPSVNLVIDLNEGLKAVLDAAVIIRLLRSSGPENAGGKRHVSLARLGE